MLLLCHTKSIQLLIPTMSDKLEKIKTSVNTLAKPAPRDLLEVRALIKNHPELQEIFETAKKYDVSVQGLADQLYGALQDHMEGVGEDRLWDICLYLSDEYFQIGDDILIVSTETGESIARITEDDVYQPPPVLRESGELATPLPRLKPEIEAAIVKGQFQKGKDERILQALATRAKSTDLLKEVGDPRLLIATSKGRKQLSERLKDELPELFEDYTGVSRTLLDACVFLPEGEMPLEDCYHSFFTLSSRILTPIADCLTVSLRHDAYASLRRRTAGQWARGLGQIISSLAHQDEPERTKLDDPHPEGIWVAGPDVARRVKGRSLVVEGVAPTLVHSTPVAYISLHPDTYECQSRELLSRWEVGAEVSGDIYVCREAVTSYVFTDLPEEEFVAEVVN